LPSSVESSMREYSKLLVASPDPISVRREEAYQNRYLFLQQREREYRKSLAASPDQFRFRREEAYQNRHLVLLTRLTP
jgi:hypothetical protein